MIDMLGAPEELPAPLEFLYYLYILSNAGGSPLPPPVKLIVSAAQTAEYLGPKFSAYDIARGPQRFGGAMSTPARTKANMGRMMYKKGGSAQPNYKSGEMHKCMPN